MNMHKEKFITLEFALKEIELQAFDGIASTTHPLWKCWNLILQEIAKAQKYKTALEKYAELENWRVGEIFAEEEGSEVARKALEE